MPIWDDEDDDNDSKLVRDLQKQLKEINTARAALEQEVSTLRPQVLEHSMAPDAGARPNDWPTWHAQLAAISAGMQTEDSDPSVLHVESHHRAGNPNPPPSSWPASTPLEGMATDLGSLLEPTEEA